MEDKKVAELLNNFSKSTDNPLSNISVFINEKLKPLYYERKEKEFVEKGYAQTTSHNKARQSWVGFVGRILERLIADSLKTFCSKHNIKITSDKYLKGKNLDHELDLVKRAILVHFNEYSLLPDADIILYKYNKVSKSVKVIAILSVKNSFRERYTETPYWKLKLLKNPTTSKIKVFMITPDNDDEVSFEKNAPRGPRKARIVMEYELDGIYLAKQEFDSSEKVKGIDYLIDDLKRII